MQGTKARKCVTAVFCNRDTLEGEARDKHDEEEIPTPEQAHEGLLPASWHDIYEQMDDGDKWVLTSGRRVENVIYEACEAMDFDTFASSPAQLFILDTSDPVVKGWFSKNEWNEITARLSPLPDADEMLVDSFQRFYSVNTTTMLREVLGSSLIPSDVTYDKNLHYNLRWAEMVIHKFSMLLEAPNDPLVQPHLDGWYGFNIWSHILDAGLIDLKGLTVERKAVTCRSCAQRRNRPSQRLTDRANLGACLDGIIRTIGDSHYEYGGIDDGSSNFKLIKSLRDMLSRLDEIVNGDPQIRQRIQVVGISTAGLALQCARLGHPGVGYVCLLQREAVIRVPTVVEALPDLLRMLVIVAQVKQLIRVSFEAVQERHILCSEESFYHGLVGGKDMRSGARLGWAASTP
ncbi:hypothetical protein HOY80DRAFT_639515 [Tuber brumale]|nr:hypothetical protein HOY80DRAFT_639515 [Tuber brumale]